MRLLKYLMARANQVSYTVLIILTIDIAQVMFFFSSSTSFQLRNY